MKVYLFNVDNGVYEGEDFCADSEVDGLDGITIIAPPQHCLGQIPVYDRASHCWKLMPVKSTLITEKRNG